MKFRFRDWLRRRGDNIELHDTYTVWDDLSIELNPSKKGSNDKPDYDFTNLGMLFPQNTPTEIAYATRQMRHNKKLDSAIKLHIHYIQSEETQPTFKVDYKFYNNNGTVPTEWTTVSTALSKGVFTYTSGGLLQIAAFPAIDAPADENVSANLDIKLYRDDNDLTGDVLAKYVDIHYILDAPGSAGEYTKWTEA